MQIGGIRGTNLVKGFGFEDNHLTINSEDARLMSIPYPMIRNAAVYHNNELEIHIPFEENNEHHDVLCEARFYIPTKEVVETTMEEGESKPTLAAELYQTIKDKANIDKNIGQLVAVLENLPLSVPRGRYTAELYS